MFRLPATEQRNPYLRANSLAELLSWHDVDFVRCAYVTILGRQPDPEGEAYYAGRIGRGYSKLEVLWQLRRSSEAANHDPGIAGLDRTLRRAARCRQPVLGWVARFMYRVDGDSPSDRHFRMIDNSLGVLAVDQHRNFLELQTMIRNLQSPMQTSALPDAAAAAAPVQDAPNSLSDRAFEIFAAMAKVR